MDFIADCSIICNVDFRSSVHWLWRWRTAQSCSQLSNQLSPSSRQSRDPQYCSVSSWNTAKTVLLCSLPTPDGSFSSMHWVNKQYLLFYIVQFQIASWTQKMQSAKLSSTSQRNLANWNCQSSNGRKLMVCVISWANLPSTLWSWRYCPVSLPNTVHVIVTVFLH